MENISKESLVIDEKYQKDNYLNVFPISKSKRILVWLCDFVISLIITYLSFHYFSYLVFYYGTNYEGIAKEAEQAELIHNEILINNNLLFREKPEDKDFSKMLKFTFDEYTKSFVKEKTRPDEFDDKDVFRTYYVNLRQKPDEYIKKLEYYDKDTLFFNIDALANRVTLKDHYVNLFKPLLTPGDELSDEGQIAYNKFSSNFFLEYYGDVIADITKNDLTYIVAGVTYSYIAEQNKINKADSVFTSNIIGASFVAVVFGFGIMYFLIPFVNKERKTLSMMMMRIQRISVVDFLPQKRIPYLLTGFFSFVTNLMMISFLAIPQISVNYIFNIPVLLIITITALALVFVSGCMILFNSSNRGLSDFATKTAYISNDDLDQVYRIKGYDV